MSNLIILGRLPGLNELLDAAKFQRRKFSPYAIMKREANLLTRAAIRNQDVKPIPESSLPARFTFHYYEKDRRRDPPNISAGAEKIIFDVLIKEGIIEDDGWRQIASIENGFFVDKEVPRIEVKWLARIKSEG